ncbi:MAG: outer membrane beta-barrel protein, partial [Bacteroidota bacterium]
MEQTNCQDIPPANSLFAKYGVFAGYNINQHLAEFSRLPGVPSCCPNYDGGTGGGFYFGFSYELPLYNRIIFGVRASYSMLNATLLKNESTLLSVDNLLVPGEFEHRIDASLAVLMFNPSIVFNADFGLNLSAGIDAGILIQKKFEQQEKIVKPADKGVFVDSRSRIRNQNSGDIQSTNPLFFGLVFAVSYDLPINSAKTLFLSPEAGYHLGLTNFVKDTKWKSNTISLGFAVKYQPRPVKKEPVQKLIRKYEIDTIVVQSFTKPKKSIGIGIENKLVSNIISSDTVFTIENFHRTDSLYVQPELSAELKAELPPIIYHINYVYSYFSLLPVVFFSSNSSVIPDEYTSSIISNENNLPSDYLVINKNTLNIIGNRLKKYPGTKISLSGYIDSRAEKNDCSIALNRINAVRDYFIEKFNIEEN